MAHNLHRSVLLCLVSLLAIFSGNRACALPPVLTRGELAITAWMDLSGGNTNGIIVEVNVNGTKDWSRPDADGRVDLVLPGDAVALIHFRQAGRLTKTVSVDTHNLAARTGKGKQTLAFGVKLEPEADHVALAYAGPVASISFDATNGGILMEKDLHMVPARQQKTVVF